MADDAQRTATLLLEGAGSLDRLTREELIRFGEETELIFAAHAPRRSGRLARGVRARFVGGEVFVRGDAVNPDTGYDYVGVTRFGHRVAFIEPKHPPKEGRYRAPIPDYGVRWVKKKAAVGFRPVKGGRVVFRRRVPGYKPSVDWATLAYPEVERAAERAVKHLGDRVIARLRAA